MTVSSGGYPGARGRRRTTYGDQGRRNGDASLSRFSARPFWPLAARAQQGDQTFAARQRRQGHRV